ncbi:DNA polymerase [Acidaminococcus fermentans DSM 20731]|uniref:DNA-directed DNA polymerase n=1 Tax=Acidaminococcus fermentans (strain ATCC 25085 / DSM 20731 / CCUG 9996 / CIP 106432 / VR4) TaxID=591001 RepID=D2RK96_ACIFV|nr:DNA polymerase [Acidaminococcus fermentans]ADB47498.1 DNA-directed DNA polymerase [Acidaminococcus fermentans DSM 20731]UEA71887.1 DNA polymerase [Acidaminococcus fermentans DSM 20731]
MKTLSIDIETYSDVNLAKCGVYKYAESPAFEILLFGYAVDGGPVQVVDLAQGESIPEEILDALTDDTVTKWAFNANFERVCLSRHLTDLGRSLDPFHDQHPLSKKCARFLNPAGWKCSMVWSAYLGLPLSLEGVGAVLNLDNQKMKEGRELIRYFCIPCKETKANGGRTRNLPQHALDKWNLFKSYNKRDVEVEMAIQQRLQKYPVPKQVWEEYHLDQEINDRGIAIDLELAKQAVALDAKSRESLMAALKERTGLENPNSVIQMLDWLEQHGLKTDSLGKKNVQELLKTAQEPLRSVLLLRQKLAKSSVKKYQAMEMTACKDGRARGMFQFYGANRTGRFAGRHIQLQNLPQNHLPDLSEARELVRQGNYEALDLLYDSIPDVLSQLIRTAFVPRAGMKFVVSDFSAIEARVISWLAGERWKSEDFAAGKDIYCSTASQMFGVPVVKHGINGNLRQKGKIAELACGYGGSVGALKAMGALDMGIPEEELGNLVQSWRSANPHIVDFWWQVDGAVKTTIKQRIPVWVNNIRFFCQSGMLFIELPSGRRLSYVKPRIGENRFGGESVTYEGIGATKKWEQLESYGPKFVENIVQGISRDILCYAMQTLRCCAIVGHVHDELIIECPKDTSVDAICEEMGRTPPWAEGLVLRADGYACEFYQKD